MTELLNIKQVQEILRLSERTVFRLIQDGELKGFKMGREWRFEASDVDALIALRRRKAEEEFQKARKKEEEAEPEVA